MLRCHGGHYFEQLIPCQSEDKAMVVDVVKGDLFYGDYAFFHCDLSLFSYAMQCLPFFVIVPIYESAYFYCMKHPLYDIRD